MKRRMVSAMTLMLLLTGMLTLAFNIQPVKAEATIYIRADGSIDPPTPLITTADNVTYTFTDNIYDEIVVERNNTVIDGNGYTLQGTGAYASKGINLSSRSNITSKNTNIKDFSYGILLSESSNISITGNNITNNSWGGIGLSGASNSTISGNHITNNGRIGITLTGLFGSSNNRVIGNALVNDGLSVWNSYGNVVMDNLVNGKPLVYLEGVSDVVVEDAGQVILVNCNRIKVENLNLSDTYIGVQLWRTGYTTIVGNTITNNGYGISLEDSSDNNSISGNTITNNSEAGIRLTYGIYSKHNSIVGNYIINNRYGIESGAENSISGNNITNNTYNGIELDSSYYSSIVGNSIKDNGYGGIYLDSSNYNNITENDVINNSQYGIRLYYSSNNVFHQNNITASNGYCIYLEQSSNNMIYHNNLISNTQNVLCFNSINIWDDGYPSGGNHWSNYTGVDLEPDGIGDSWYEIDSSNIDHYPLKGMFSDFDATSEHSVQTICNSSISGFQYGDSSIRFNVTGEDGTAGFCRICIPTALMNATYRVFVNGTEVQCNLLPCSNSTHSYLYFSYSHSIKEIVIIPELASLIILPLFMLATLIVVIICNKKRIDIT